MNCGVESTLGPKVDDDDVELQQLGVDADQLDDLNREMREVAPF